MTEQDLFTRVGIRPQPAAAAVTEQKKSGYEVPKRLE